MNKKANDTTYSIFMCLLFKLILNKLKYIQFLSYK